MTLTQNACLRACVHFNSRARGCPGQCTSTHRAQSARYSKLLRAQSALHNMTEEQATATGNASGEVHSSERQLVVPVDGSDVRSVRFSWDAPAAPTLQCIVPDSAQTPALTGHVLLQDSLRALTWMLDNLYRKGAHLS